MIQSVKIFIANNDVHHMKVDFPVQGHMCVCVCVCECVRSCFNFGPLLSECAEEIS